MSEKPVKKRICVALTKAYVDPMERLIREEAYVSRAEVIKDALRRLFRHYGIEFTTLEGGDKDQP
ncbi:MAG: ribbon-helix-helix domain-containing protein [Candidatus Bathyarchaeota archaeon]